MGTTHIFSGVVISRMEAKTVCLYAFLLERYYGNKRGEKIAPIEVQSEDHYIRYSQNFVEAISILLSSAENIKNITHWMKMNCFMRILLKNEQLHLLKN